MGQSCVDLALPYINVKVAQLCPTLCDPMNCSPPGSSVHGDSLGKNTGVGCQLTNTNTRQDNTIIYLLSIYIVFILTYLWTF